MSSPNIDTVISSNPWFQEDYRSSSPFRGKQVVDLRDDWNTEKPEQTVTSEKTDEGKFGKYSLVIVIPSNTDTKVNTEVPNVQVNAQVDSGVGSMSPSPPKTPTPDYDSLEDIFDDDYYATGIADGLSPVSLPVTTKKVHFSVASDTSDDSDDKSPTATSKATSWRDALVVNHVDYQDHLSFCYRQDWANGEVKSKAISLSRHPVFTTVLTEDLDQRSRTESRRKRNTKLVRRSSSLDRLADLRYSYRNKDRTPLLCDPDPLKVPGATGRKNLGRRAQRQAAMER